MAVKLAEGPTVSELAERYLEKHVAVRCKPRTASMYRLIVGKYILPELGRRPALAVGHKEVTELHHALSAKPVMANQVLDTLSRIYNAAEDRGQIPEASNPCRLVVKNRERKRERFLTDEEFRRLGRVLDEAETCKGVSVHAVAAIRLPDTKTGPRTISLSPEAARVLAAIPCVDGNPFVIVGRIRGKAMRNLNDPWDIVCERAGLKDMRLHDCRHSYASRALALGESLPMIGRLLGHTQVETTARYAHLAQDSVRESAVRVAESIAGDVLAKYLGPESVAG